MREMREALVAESAVLDKGCPRWHLSGMATTIEVTECLLCPLSDPDYGACCRPTVLADGGRPDRKISLYGVPDWCPLRTEDALVTLRVKETPDAR